MKELLFTCDGAGALAKNTTNYLDEGLITANIQLPAKTLEHLKELQPNKPILGRCEKKIRKFPKFSNRVVDRLVQPLG